MLNYSSYRLPAIVERDERRKTGIRIPRRDAEAQR